MRPKSRVGTLLRRASTASGVQPAAFRSCSPLGVRPGPNCSKSSTASSDEVLCSVASPTVLFDIYLVNNTDATTGDNLWYVATGVENLCSGASYKEEIVCLRRGHAAWDYDGGRLRCGGDDGDRNGPWRVSIGNG